MECDAAVKEDFESTRDHFRFAEKYPSSDLSVSPVIQCGMPKGKCDGWDSGTSRSIKLAMHDPGLTLRLMRPNGESYYIEIFERRDLPVEGDMLLDVSVTAIDKDGMAIDPHEVEISGHTSKKDRPGKGRTSEEETLTSCPRGDRVANVDLRLEFDHVGRR